jgi:uncharacterized protein with von Willebrand factor type A (vWA) domain
MLSITPLPGVDPGVALRSRLTGFAGFLHANGYGVGGGDSPRVLAAVEQVGILDAEILRWSLKSLLCARGGEWQRFDALFDAYFLPPNKKVFTEKRLAAGDGRRAAGARFGDARVESPATTSGEEAVDAGGGGRARHGASREESLASTDFRDHIAGEHADRLEALMRRFARRLKRLELRREARFARGRRLDLQATIRQSVASGGTPFRLAWRGRRRVRPRLVLLLDVSRSMSHYSFFYLRLARALCRALSDVHCFIFHTRLTGVAEALRDPDPWRSQERLHLLAAGWAGGTRIGECLQAFNREHAPRLVHSRTGVIIVSDGYDTGEPVLVTEALAALRRRARRLIWLNPLLRNPGFIPESRGMRAALPHLDLFAPGADLAGIEPILARVIATLR